MPRPRKALALYTTTAEASTGKPRRGFRRLLSRYQGCFLIKHWLQDAVGAPCKCRHNQLGLLNEQRFLALEIITAHQTYGRGRLPQAVRLNDKNAAKAFRDRREHTFLECLLQCCLLVVRCGTSDRPALLRHRRHLTSELPKDTDFPCK
jgi:hypothetical protein